MRRRPYGIANGAQLADYSDTQHTYLCKRTALICGIYACLYAELFLDNSGDSLANLETESSTYHTDAEGGRNRMRNTFLALLAEGKGSQSENKTTFATVVPPRFDSQKCNPLQAMNLNLKTVTRLH
jgi:hypothetical protein